MRIFCVTVLISCAVVISGCIGKPVMTSTSTQPDQMQGAALHGVVHGGQQPITGADVYLYAVGTGGYGGNGIAASSSNASTSLLNSNVLSQTPAGGEDGSNNYYVTTDSNGSFSITGDYTCPSASTQVYLYAVGGNPGAGSNSAAGLLAGLGSCGSLSSSTFVFVNEVSTIATAYSLAGFATDATHISSSGSTLALTGAANASGTVANLETLGTGVALTTTPGGAGNVPQSLINTLADILAACINSTGPGSSGCTTLLGGALSGGTTGTAPTDTATAAINIAHNPGASVAALYGLVPGTGAPFLPDLSPQPSDFSMEISYPPGPNNYGFFTDLAIDGSGNAWFVGGYGTGGDGVGEILASNLGWSPNTPMRGGGMGGPSQPVRLAIDPSENVWVVIASGGPINSVTLVELNSSGTALSGPGGYFSTTGPFYDLTELTIDGSGNVWLPNLAPVIWKYTPGTGFSLYNGGGLDGPAPIAADIAGDVWTEDDSDDSLSEFNSSGTPLSPSTGWMGLGVSSLDIAIDASGDVWIPSSVTDSIVEYSSSGTPISPSGGYSGGLPTGYGGIAIDGADNVWVGGKGNTYGTSVLTELSPSGAVLSGTNGYGASTDLATPYFIRVDGSGNVWVENSGYINAVEFIGLAAPVVTPLPANLTAPYGAHAVNRP